MYFCLVALSLGIQIPKKNVRFIFFAYLNKNGIHPKKCTEDRSSEINFDHKTKFCFLQIKQYIFVSFRFFVNQSIFIFQINLKYQNSHSAISFQLNTSPYFIYHTLFHKHIQFTYSQRDRETVGFGCDNIQLMMPINMICSGESYELVLCA